MTPSFSHYAMKSTIALAVLVLCFPPVGRAADPIPLRAGPLTMVFEPDNAFLRYLKVGDREVLRGISAPVRDEFWGTVPPRVSNIRRLVEADRFRLSFDVHCRQREIDFRWHGTITGSAAGELEYTFDGTAQSDFRRNRIGFCVLHGPSAAGQRWVIENTRGEKSPGVFPSFISPHQPAKDLRGITHEVGGGLSAEVRFEGEIFEMEDQRNWTDASFKTYCIPLALPYPVQVTAGTRVYQKINLRLLGEVPSAASLASGPPSAVDLTLADPVSELPRLGLQLSHESRDLTDLDVAALRALKLDHVRAEVMPADPALGDQLRRATAQAQALGLKLHLGLHLGPAPEAELQKLRREVEAVKPPVSLWLLITTNLAEYALARQILGPVKGSAPLSFGHDANFTELNRQRPEDPAIEAVSYAINPTIHAIDSASMVETLPIQGDTVRSARQFSGSRPIVVSPVTLRPQALNRPPSPGELPANVDLRQPSLFAAGWTIGSIKHLAEAGAQIATYFETVGWKGIMESSRRPHRSVRFPTQRGELFPVYQVLRDVGEFAGGRVLKLTSKDDLAVVGLALRQGQRTRLLVANLTAQPQQVRLHGLSGGWTVRRLNQANWPRQTGELDRWLKRPGEALPDSGGSRLVSLDPHGVARLDQ